MVREHYGVTLSGSLTTFEVAEKYLIKLREKEQRAKAQKGSSQGGDVRREVNPGEILTHEDLVNLEFRMVPEVGYVNGYGKLLEQLRRLCSKDKRSAQPKVEVYGNKLVRPLTAREYLLARIIDYERRYEDGKERTIDDRLRLFNEGSWTSAGILWKYPGDKLVPVERKQALVPVRAKVSTICLELLRLTPDFKDDYVEVPDFDSFEGEEIDLSQGIWDQRLTRAQVLDHEGWRKLVGDDEEGGRILRDYAGIVFSEVQRLYKESKAMGFWKRSSIKTNELRAPWVDDIDYRFNALGNIDLILNCASVRVSQAP